MCVDDVRANFPRKAAEFDDRSHVRKTGRIACPHIECLASSISDGFDERPQPVAPPQ
jgi:hypothetical protein